MSATRAEFRRQMKAKNKAADYAKSGFDGRAVYLPFQQKARTGSEHNGAYTTEELLQRATDRREQRRLAEKGIYELMAAQRKAASAIKLEAKIRERTSFLASFGKPQPLKYRHSAARQSAALFDIAA